MGNRQLPQRDIAEVFAFRGHRVYLLDDNGNVIWKKNIKHIGKVCKATIMSRTTALLLIRHKPSLYILNFITGNVSPVEFEKPKSRRVFKAYQAQFLRLSNNTIIVDEDHVDLSTYDLATATMLTCVKRDYASYHICSINETTFATIEPPNLLRVYNTQGSTKEFTFRSSVQIVAVHLYDSQICIGHDSFCTIFNVETGQSFTLVEFPSKTLVINVLVVGKYLAVQAHCKWYFYDITNNLSFHKDMTIDKGQFFKAACILGDSKIICRNPLRNALMFISVQSFTVQPIECSWMKEAYVLEVVPVGVDKIMIHVLNKDDVNDTMGMLQLENPYMYTCKTTISEVYHIRSCEI
jgi:hypothetical protein